MNPVVIMPNWSLIEMTWRQWREPALDWWGRLTESEWDEINGNRERLLELLELKYGWSREDAEREIETRFSEFGSSPG